MCELSWAGGDAFKTTHTVDKDQRPPTTAKNIIHPAISGVNEPLSGFHFQGDCIWLTTALSPRLGGVFCDENPLLQPGLAKAALGDEG
jgi:hypothetical protein